MDCAELGAGLVLGLSQLQTQFLEWYEQLYVLVLYWQLGIRIFYMF